MLIALPLAVGMVAALAWRYADGPGGKRAVLLVAGLALGIRLVAVLIVSIIAHQTHGTGVWLNDEASFFLATEALLPDPINGALPQGLDHLAGDGYLGLTSVLAVAGGVADANTFRVINAGLGSMVVVLSMLTARRMFGPSAGLVSGLVLAIWPTLVLWSATMLRDTMGSLAVVAVWWTLGRARELGWVRMLATLVASLVIALSLRPYLGGGILVGVFAWAAYLLLRGRSRRVLATVGALSAALVVGVVASQSRRIDFAAHELLYRQTVSRMEVLGRLYTDEPALPGDQPIRPGVIVAVIDQASGSLLTGVVQEFAGPDLIRVAFTDETIREIPAGDVQLIQGVQIPPLQLAARIGPDVFDYLAGLSTTSEPSSPLWIAMALAWDAVVLLAALAAVRLRLNPREWLFPLCIVAATVLALIAVPGAPGNADRHRATQTIPLLLVLASGSMWSGTWVKQLSTLWRSAVRRAVRQVPLSVRG